MQSLNEDIIAGATAGAVGRVLTAPLDVIKIRSLWKGNIPATYLWIGYSMCQFGSYGPIHKMLSMPVENGSHATSPRTTATTSSVSTFLIGTWCAGIPFVAGATAGVVATTLTYPLDIMRTQFALQGQVMVHKSMASYVTHTLQTEGIKGFYAGLPAALVGIAPLMGLNFFVYEHSMSLQKELQKKFDVEASGELAKMGLSGLCGALAGGLSKLLMFPLDTIKKRLQAQVLFNTMMHHPTAPAGMQHTLVKGSHHVGEYDGVCHCISGVYAREGVTGFYKGIAPTLMKSITSTAITFAVFEGTKSLLERHWEK